MEHDFSTTIDDVLAMLSEESEFVLTELSTAAHTNVDDRKAILDDAMIVSDKYTKLFEAMSGFEQKRKDAELKEKELDLKAREIELKQSELDKKGEELDLKRTELENKSKENSENAVQQKRTARIETVKYVGDIALKCGLLFAQGALYVWGVNKTFDFEGFHTASTSIGRNLLNNVSSLFIKK